MLVRREGTSRVGRPVVSLVTLVVALATESAGGAALPLLKLVSAYDAGSNTVTVNVNVSDLDGSLIVGGQFFLQYVETKLSFKSIVPGDAPFTFEIFQCSPTSAPSEVCTPTDGVIDYSIIIPVEGTGSSADTTMARITFNVIGEVCDMAAVVSWDKGHQPPSGIVNDMAGAKDVNLIDLEAIVILGSPPITETPVVSKNRYISVATADPGVSQAMRVRFVDLPPPFDIWNWGNSDQDFVVGEPFKLCENSGNGSEVVAPDDCGPAGGLSREWFWAAPLVCDKGEAHFMDWHGECDEGGTCVGGLLEDAGCATDEDCVDVVHLFHEGFVPDGVYEVQVVDSSCSLHKERNYSTPLTMTQGKWGDICGPGPGGACTGVADGSADVAQDILGLIDKFQNINALQKSRADLVPGDNGINNGPDFKITIAGDALFALDAFQGFPYPFTPGDPCGPG